MKLFGQQVSQVHVKGMRIGFFAFIVGLVGVGFGLASWSFDLPFLTVPAFFLTIIGVGIGFFAILLIWIEWLKTFRPKEKGIGSGSQERGRSRS